MIYRYSEAKKRNVGDNMQITDLYPVKNMPMDFVIGELNGFHGTFCNTKNNKYYFILEEMEDLATTELTYDDGKFEIRNKKGRLFGEKI